MVRKAIDSALSQSYSNIEVLVVDNASDDEIETVVAGYQDSRLHFFRNTKNLGIFRNFNRCIELSHGDYIHILHSDDFIDSDFTKKCLEFFKTHPSVMMTFGSAQFLSGNEPVKKIAVSDHDIVYPAPQGFRKILEEGNPIICPSVMIKREVYETVGVYPLEYPYAGDFYQWLKISQKFDIAFVADATLFYRTGNHSESFQFLQKTPLGYIDIIKIMFQIIADLGDDISSYRHELNIFLRKHLYVCLGAGIRQPDFMRNFSPLIFIGFSFNLWTLVRPESLIVRINKFFDFLVLSGLVCIFILPGGRSCLNKIVGFNEKPH